MRPITFPFSTAKLKPVSAPFVGVALVAFACSLGGCGTARYAVVGTAAAQTAYGEVRVTRKRGDERLVHIALDRLPPPATFDDSATRFVAWQTLITDAGEMGTPRALGELKYDPAKQSASFSAHVKESERFVLTISAENPNEATAPSGSVIATQTIREK